MPNRFPLQAPGRGLIAWRFFPWYLAGGIGIAMAVNAVLVWLAVASFPGLATQHGFNTSNGYDRVLDAAQRQAALGWVVRDMLDGAVPVVTLAGPDGAPLAGARLAATIERPLGAAAPEPLAFRDDGAGRYVAETVLERGKWDLSLTVTQGGQAYHTVRRVVVK